MRVVLRPTRPADLSAVIGEPLPFRIRTITAELDGQVLGIGGLAYRPEGVVEVFSQITPEGRRYPVALHRAGLAVMAMLRSTPIKTAIATTNADFAAGATVAATARLRGGAPRVPGTCRARSCFCWSRECGMTATQPPAR